MNFEPIEGWGRLPEGWRYVECASPRAPCPIPRSARSSSQPSLGALRFESISTSPRLRLQPAGPGLVRARKSFRFLDGPLHALEATAQGLQSLFVGDDVQPVGQDGAQHTLGDVLGRQRPADQRDLAAAQAVRVLQMRGTVP